MIAQDPNSLECGRERSRGRLKFTQMRELVIMRDIRIRLMREKVMAQKFEFTWIRELVVASDVSNLLECGWVIAQEIRISSNAEERSLGRFEFERKWGRSCAMIIRSIAGACNRARWFEFAWMWLSDCAGNSSLIDCGRVIAREINLIECGRDWACKDSNSL